MPLQIKAKSHNNKNLLQWLKSEVTCPVIDINEITLNNFLGKGQFGEVWVGNWRGKRIAIKKFFQRNNTNNNNVNMDAANNNNNNRNRMEGVPEFLNEVNVLNLIREAGGHKNIVKFYGVCANEDFCGIVMEFVSNGTLKQALASRSFNLREIMSFSKDIAEGLQFLQNLNCGCILQRDLKPENLLLDHNNNVVIGDFGLSSIMKRGTSEMRDSATGRSLRGSPIWMAPEMLLFKNFNHKSDIYSFAIVLWEMLTLDEPYSQFTRLKPFRVAVCYRDTRPVLPDNLHPLIQDLLHQCWHKEPSFRPCASELVTLIDEIMVQL